MRGQTLTLAQTLPDIIRQVTSSMHTCLPARVTSYSTNPPRVDVILLTRRVEGSQVSEYPKLTDIPVCLSATSAGGVTYPIPAGSHGLLVFAEVSVDEAVLLGRVSTPADPRRYHLSDGFFIPGSFFGDARTPARYSDATEVSCGEARLILRDGRVALGSGVVEVLQILSDVIDALSTTTVMVDGTPTPLSSKLTMDSLRDQLETIRGSL
jgi:hypothetical protein